MPQPRTPTDDIDLLTPEQLRERIRAQRLASRTRGQNYRAAKMRARLVRFSVFVPEDARDAVRRAVETVLRRYNLAAAADPVAPFTLTPTDSRP